MTTSRLETIWTAPAPLPTAPPRRRGIAAGNAAAWPLAALLIAHRLVVLAWAGSVTDDFTTVWSAARRFVERVPVYNEVYHHVDPHYLYSPGATLLLSPLGLSPTPEAVRPLFVLANAVAIILALAWLTRMAGFTLSHTVFPVALALGFATEAVTNTLVFANINGILLLGLVAFLWALLNRREWIAGIVLGLCVLIKPMFAPLLVLPLMRLHWRALAAGVAVPLLFNVVAWPVTPGTGDYVDRLVPYLGQTRDYANSSLAGFAVYFGAPGWLHAILFILCAAAVVAALVALARFRWSEGFMWASTSSSLLIAGVCLLSSLGQAYYSMMLFPAIFTVLGRVSPMHFSATWVGIILCLSPLRWESPRFPDLGVWLGTFLPTAGWAIFILSVAAWAVATAATAATAPARETDTERAAHARSLEL
ncbi:glycosyltransferase family 87 protein [Corynebacterium timonense]|uniref:Arabinofuranan 3-O-arabinosyltransferase n=1 Tax=Corynebacterium timonense TaxID=441500 RepID=A0A1H1NH50_9CORY|nr:glycosyltransferase family 87 protein [Corynebacterium timonense]SDR98371.1 arabinofuranan 3-O-arabinosyltransferase [Corynebacterium timonense]